VRLTGVVGLSVSFYPLDAMLALVLAMALCPSICLSQVGVLSKRMDESSCFYGMGAFFHMSYTVLKGNSDIFKNKGTSLELCPKLRT